jgi:acyl carrier protein
MELIAEIERRFGVVFTAEHFERKSFFNIAGLARLIAEISEYTP